MFARTLIYGATIHVVASLWWLLGFVLVMQSFTSSGGGGLSWLIFFIHDLFFFPIWIAEFIGVPTALKGAVGNEGILESMGHGFLGPSPSLLSALWSLVVGGMLVRRKSRKGVKTSGSDGTDRAASISMIGPRKMLIGAMAIVGVLVLFFWPTKLDSEKDLRPDQRSDGDVVRSKGQWTAISRDGAPVKVQVGKGEPKISVVVKCWSDAPVPFRYDPYDWRFEIEVLDGKLVRCEDPNFQEAPKVGYLENSKIGSTATLKQWRGVSGSIEYWIQLGDGSFGKMRVKVQTGRKHQVLIEVLHNTEAGRWIGRF